jgi:hypothetical protein
VIDTSQMHPGWFIHLYSTHYTHQTPRFSESSALSCVSVCLPGQFSSKLASYQKPSDLDTDILF